MCARVYIFIHKYAYIYTYVYMHVCTYIYAYTYHRLVNKRELIKRPRTMPKSKHSSGTKPCTKNPHKNSKQNMHLPTLATFLVLLLHA